MFPKKKCLKVVKKDGKEYVWIQMTNVISPIAVPDKIDLGDFDPKDAPEYADIAVNGTELELTLEDVKKYVEIWTDGKGYTYDDILVDNKAAGITIPVGGKLTLLIDKDYPGLADTIEGPGDYEVKVDVKLDNPMSITVKAQLKDIGVEFDPSET